MSTLTWFKDLAVLSELSGEDAVAALRALGEKHAADKLETALLETSTGPPDKFSIPAGVLDDRAFMHRGRVVGHLEPARSPVGLRPLREVDDLVPDEALAGERLNIGLDAFHAADYPGGERHHLLFHCAATHHLDPPERLHMRITRPVEQSAPFLILDQPLFAGLTAGAPGLDLRLLVLTVRDARDRALLDALDTDLARLGLQLLAQPQPAAALFSDQTFQLTAALRSNAPPAIHSVSIDLGFERRAGSVPLALGTYVVVQAPRAYEVAWDWDEWRYDPESGRIVRPDEPEETLPFNYLVFTIDRARSAPKPRRAAAARFTPPALEPVAAVPDLELRVRIRKNVAGPRLLYELQSDRDDLGLFHKEIVGPNLESSPGEFQARLISEIEGLSKGFDGDDLLLRDEIEGRLADIGRRLYDQLFPTELRQAYLRVRGEVRTLQIVSDEPWIPWELVKPFDKSDPLKPIDDDFLGLRFELTRWLANSAPAAREIRVDRLAALNAGAVPGSVPLPSAADEEDLVRRLGAGRTGVEDVTPGRATVPELERLLAEARVKLLHVTAHGKLDSDDPDAARIYMVDRRTFRADRLLGPLTARVPENRPLVFFNACRVSQQGYSLTGLGGWAQAWIGCGCGAFVGPQWTVRDKPAFEFARAFYQALEDGSTFGQAARAARRHVRDADPGSPLWLAPVVYAHPNGRLVWGR